MAKLKSIINKLQRALTMRGRYIMVNQNQFYFDEIDKICTKYVLIEKKRNQRQNEKQYSSRNFQSNRCCKLSCQFIEWG